MKLMKLEIQVIANLIANLRILTKDILITWDAYKNGLGMMKKGKKYKLCVSYIEYQKMFRQQFLHCQSVSFCV